MPHQYPHLSDAELILRLSESDEKAFTHIYNRYWERLLSVAFNKLNKDIALAENVLQDIFLDIWRRRKDMATIKNLSAYLATALKYKIIDTRLKQARLNALKERTDPGQDHDYSTTQHLSFLELQDRLAKLVKDLPEKCQLVYRLSKESDYSQKEIAKILDISEKTVEAHIARAVKTLRAGLGNFFSLFML